MTNLERLRTFPKDELIEFLDNNSYEDAEWMDWFNQEHCQQCPVITPEGDDREFAFCEIYHYCKAIYDKYGEKEECPSTRDIIAMWLDEEV